MEGRARMHDEPGVTDRSIARRSGVHFTILGQIEVTVDGRPVDPGPPKQRLLLALLLCRANRPVPVDQLTEALWDDRPPRTARKNVQVYVTALRKIIGDRISFTRRGYTLRVDDDEVDLIRFERYASSARRLLRQGDRSGAARLLDGAIRCWQGSPLADFTDSAAAVRESERLEAGFLSVYEDWAEVKAGLGEYGDVLAGIDEHVGRHPFRERLGVARMTALAGCGRTAEALAHYDDVRQRMARELGLHPSPVLTALYRRILAGESATPQRATTARLHAGGLPAEVSGLPRDVPDLVGRCEELARLGRLLAPDSSADVAVITGPAGIGKTATAVRAAHRLAASFPDGAAFVSLRDPAGARRGAPQAMAELLRQAGYADATAAQAGGLWRSWLAERRMLLVLDDATDEETVRAMLPGLGRNRMIVTSRLRLSGLEAVSRVELLELSIVDSLALLGGLIGADRLAAEPAAAESLVELCGRIPLAVRIAGTRLAALRSLSIRQYADRIADERTLFDELVAGGLSVRDRFDEWIGTVPQDCRRAVRRLGVRDGAVLAREDMLTLLAGANDPAEHVLGQLIELNLVSVPDGEVLAHHEVYSMTALLRRYARSRLVGSSDEH